MPAIAFPQLLSANVPFLDDLVVQFALAVLNVTVAATAIACIDLRMTRFFLATG
jgi:hypothetical protein